MCSHVLFQLKIHVSLLILEVLVVGCRYGNLSENIYECDEGSSNDGEDEGVVTWAFEVGIWRTLV